MSKFGWTRLAQLTITLAVIALLVKLASFGLDSARQDFLTSAARFIPETTSEQTIPNKNPEDLIGNSKLRPSGETREISHEDDHDTAPSESLYKNVNFSKEAPVFYRSAVKAPKKDRGKIASSETPKATSGKVCKNVNAAPKGAKIVFPLTRDNFDTYDDSWGAARPQGGHEGTDLMIEDGTPEFAITDGTVKTVSGANGNGWNTLGGYTVMIEAAYSIGPIKKGDLFYYAHMNRPTELKVGDQVKVGDVVGYAGDTGYGPEVTTGQFPPHLHLGWYDVSSGRSQLASGAMNPYPLLEWLKANGGSIKGGSDVPYCEAPQTSNPTPSDGGYWQYPTDPGVRPDMETGNDEAAPTPDAKPVPSAESSPEVQPEEPVEVVQNPTDPNAGQAIQPEQTGASGDRPKPVQDGSAAQAIPSVPDTFDEIREWIGSVVPRPDRPKPDKPKPDKPKPDKPNKPDKPDKPPKPDRPEETTPDDDPPGEDNTCEVSETDSEQGAAGEQYRDENCDGPEDQAKPDSRLNEDTSESAPNEERTAEPVSDEGEATTGEDETSEPNAS